MTSKERVNSVLYGKNFDRFPMWYGGAPETTENIMKFIGATSEDEAMDMLGIDFRTIRPRYVGPELKTYPDKSYDTFWGIRRGGYYYGQALNHPLANAETVRDVEKYNWPETSWWDVKFTCRDIEDSRDYCVMGGPWAPFFHDIMELLGTEKFFIDMHLNPAVVEAVVTKVFEHYYEVAVKTMKTGEEYFYYV